jgi:hypothetical protein
VLRDRRFEAAQRTAVRLCDNEECTLLLECEQLFINSTDLLAYILQGFYPHYSPSLRGKERRVLFRIELALPRVRWPKPTCAHVPARSGCRGQGGISQLAEL